MTFSWHLLTCTLAKRHSKAVRIVKLYKNNLGRAFASSMMDWLTHTPVPVIELEAKICVMALTALTGVCPRRILFL